MLCVATTLTFAQEKEETNKWSSSRPDGHAPISVMADHVHHKGEFMFSYRYMTMDMRQLRQGTDDATTANGHANYMVAPLDMTMNMHMSRANNIYGNLGTCHLRTRVSRRRSQQSTIPL